MESTVSVSQGVFVFNNGFKHPTSTKRTKKTTKKHKLIQKRTSLLDDSIWDSFWYKAYTEVWEQIQTKIDVFQKNTYDQILSELVNFLQESGKNDVETIGTAAVLTGINQCDHISQFLTLSDKIAESLEESWVVVLESKNNSTIKACLEHVILGFIEQAENEEVKLKRHEITMRHLNDYYEEKVVRHGERRDLVLLLADFEAFPPEVLQDLILILHSYRKTLPFTFVFGIATSAFALHQNLSYETTSKISVKVFQSESSSATLNKIIDNIFLSPVMPFNVSGRTFRLLMDIFLYYDFSVHGFIHGFKFCVLEHFCQGNIYGLCSRLSDQIIEEMTNVDFKAIRNLMSFRKYVELQSPRMIIQLLTDDEILREEIPKMLVNAKKYWFNFHVALKVFHTIIKHVPTQAFGKNLRELYPVCVSSNVPESTDFKDIIRLVAFLSNDEIIKLLKEIKIVVKSTYGSEPSDEIRSFLKDLKKIKKTLNSSHQENVTIEEEHTKPEKIASPMNRFELKKQLQSAAKSSRPKNAYAKAAEDISERIKQFLSNFLIPISKAPVLFEIFTFLESDVAKSHIVGTPRSAIHTALVNPAHYFQCKCCESDGENCSPSMPDISIAYKLHLEHGRMINLFDWLQSFKVLAEGLENIDGRVDPKMQARFTLAVAELQFLGFIKSTKKKTDHVVRLTW